MKWVQIKSKSVKIQPDRPKLSQKLPKLANILCYGHTDTHTHTHTPLALYIDCIWRVVKYKPDIK